MSCKHYYRTVQVPCGDSQLGRLGQFAKLMNKLTSNVTLSLSIIGYVIFQQTNNGILLCNVRQKHDLS